MKSFIIVAALLLVSANSFEVTRSVDRTSVVIGEPLILTISAERSKAEKLLFPGPGSSFGDFELKDMRSEIEDKGERVIERKQYQLQIFKLDHGTIPPLKIVLSTDTSNFKLTDSVTIIIKSSLTPADTGDIHGIYNPVQLPLGKKFWIILAVTLVTLAALLYLFDRFVRKRKTIDLPPPPPPEPPQNVFEKEIAELMAERLLEKGEVKIFHLRISEILRKYIGSRYNFVALESTTTELIDILRTKDVSAPVIRKVEAFSSVNDPVKFAKWIPSNDVSEGLVNYAREIVQDSAN